MRANLDGSNIETLVDTSKGDARPGADLLNGVSASLLIRTRGQIYGRKKGPMIAGRGRIFVRRSTSELVRRRRTARHRLLFDGLAGTDRSRTRSEKSVLYWTDRGDPPRGNTVNRASIDADFQQASDIRNFAHAFDGGNRIALVSKGTGCSSPT